MSRVNYYQIELDLKAALEADPDLQGVLVCVEEDQAPAILESPTVLIFLEGRTSPAELQAIAAGQQTRMWLRLSLWCYAVDFNSWADAQRQRDDLIGKVELALMRNRSINGAVNTLWLEGGQFSSGGPSSGPGGWVSAGEIVVTADVLATT